LSHPLREVLDFYRLEGLARQRCKIVQPVRMNMQSYQPDVTQYTPSEISSG
jgi:hypothetical protein